MCEDTIEVMPLHLNPIETTRVEALLHPLVGGASEHVRVNTTCEAPELPGSGFGGETQRLNSLPIPNTVGPTKERDWGGNTGSEVSQ